ncbi:hypothetical protein DUNSADRAFT_12391 [Dunaliella salina]|uniref:Uncharacterized protein n=1 Tax=Dunaliella salina TaxID=3046 RepID=A0ABQ7GBC3_DUNSA|nr:hypothetical protein DUNSADRAFT_12391 [Dunaliella salina]|eukprot:KAF5831904.1 hypothetical protein DUNSADRAFT_12391 [Dunaliella salina]
MLAGRARPLAMHPSSQKHGCRHAGTRLVCKAFNESNLSSALASGVIVTGMAASLIPWAAEQMRPKKCQTCYGAGFYPCKVCHGRGKVGGCFAEAPPLSACEACQARGRMRCPKCSGKGILNSWLWRPANDPGWGPRGE